MVRLSLIFLAGGLGSILRYWVQGWTQRITTTAFPVGTLVVNISGCLVIGFLGGLFFGPRPVQEDYRFAIMTGLLGGYTTFSTFGWETMQLANNRAWLLAMLNVMLSLMIGLTAVWAGRQMAQAIYGS